MTLLESLSVVSLALGIVAMLGKFLIVNPLKSYIKELTNPIQPHANGGRSLPDLDSYLLVRLRFFGAK